MSLLSALTGRVLLMDGAMGTQLQCAGLSLGECSALWNLTHPRIVQGIHSRYLAAGAEVLLANSFLSDPVNLARHQAEDRLDEINRAAVELARRAAGGPRLVLGDIGPILTPGRYEEFADRDALQRTASSLGDADALLFETCSTPAALSAIEFVLHRVAATDGLPLLLSLTYLRRDGELVTYSGHRPESFARHAARHGVAALGVNCGKDINLTDVCEILRRYRAETDLPLFARPNAGTPKEGVYPRSTEMFAAGMNSLIAAGAAMVGGCCGTTPEHLAGMKSVIER